MAGWALDAPREGTMKIKIGRAGTASAGIQIAGCAYDGAVEVVAALVIGALGRALRVGGANCHGGRCGGTGRARGLNCW